MSTWVYRVLGRKWNSMIDFPRWCHSRVMSDFVMVEPRAAGRAMQMSSLHAVEGPWTLPRWPTRSRVRQAMEENWGLCARQARIHQGAPFYAEKMLFGDRFDSLKFPEIPDEWSNAEA